VLLRNAPRNVPTRSRNGPAPLQQGGPDLGAATG